MDHARFAFVGYIPMLNDQCRVACRQSQTSIEKMHHTDDDRARQKQFRLSAFQRRFLLRPATQCSQSVEVSKHIRDHVLAAAESGVSHLPRTAWCPSNGVLSDQAIEACG